MVGVSAIERRAFFLWSTVNSKEQSYSNATMVDKQLPTEWIVMTAESI